MQRGSDHRYIYWAASIWLLVGAYQLWTLRDAPIGDFANYYYASQALTQDAAQEAQLYEPYTFNLWVNERTPEDVFVNYAPVPPLSTLVYLPIATIADVYKAKLLFNVFGLLFFVAVFLFGMRDQRKRQEDNRLDSGIPKPSEQGHIDRSLPRWAIIIIPLVLWTPILNNFFQGQSYLYMLSFLWLGYIFWRRNKPLAAAFFWALAISLKIFPAIILLFLLLKRSYQVFGWTIAFVLVFSTLPVLELGFSTVLEYYQEILPRLFAGEINDPFTILYQSPRVFIDQLFIYDGHLNDTPLTHLPWLAHLLYLLFQWCILGLLIQLIWKGNLPNRLAFGTTLLAGLLLSGYGSNYSMLLLFFPAIAIVSNNQIQKHWQWMLTLFLLFLAGNTPIYKLEDWPFLAQFPRMYALLIVFVGMYFLVLPRPQPKIWLVIGGLLILKWGFSGIPQTHLTDYYLPDGQYPIIFDYEPSADGLLLKHYRGQGPEEDLYLTTDRIYEDAQLAIEDQQVSYAGQPLTANKGRKKKPMRLNENEVIYLSDEGRGVGFYTLRKIRLP